MNAFCFCTIHVNDSLAISIGLILNDSNCLIFKIFQFLLFIQFIQYSGEKLQIKPNQIHEL